MTQTLGIIGAGHLASYTVAGLRNGGDNRRIVVSPRNRELSARLGRDYGCEVVASNQAVIDTADWILLAVRPEFLNPVLAECRFRGDQLVISCIAGAVPICPPCAEVKVLFGCLGSVIPLDNEE
ncbi:hypothetical protein A8C75_06840 [Marinobacterium aestuarii]|uniref:Pyrroline-5-carboxylate reductase catalytic N-terminal domain-containing protein n=1 Tax=Marinobacterium aestuarii TaxID=1821621 RepID=A0A1A9EVP2_9GAMM|nr:NAD(P)-binding domain-containing protein [Marinobacterium aestuarii]ANG62234.1 hypothetical protein A8C75_06840 [Marinobacterium aestuarii]